MTQMNDKKENWYQLNFEMFEKSLNGEASSFVHSMRKDAIARFSRIGFPTTKEEEWKYTDVAQIARRSFKPIIGRTPSDLKSADVEQFLLGHPDWNRLVFVNGHFSPELSSVAQLPKGVKMGSLAKAIKNDTQLVESHLGRYAAYDQNAFATLSTAFLQDGAFVYIPKGLVIDQPLHLLFISTGSDESSVSDSTESSVSSDEPLVEVSDEPFVANPRNVIIVEENSQVAVLESYVSLNESVYFTNVVTEISVGPNAVVEYDKFQKESAAGYHIASTYVHQERSSNYTSNLVTMGARLSRNNVFAMLDGEGIECTLNGLYLGTDDQHIDNHTTIDHAKPHCNSYELYKGILDGKSKGVFNGKIVVRKDAQKTDAKQTNKNLVLSDAASVDTKPQLEIFANDVKCTHGATIGQLDQEAIFYLRSRGITADDARDLLIHAFASDVIQRIKSEGVRQNLEQLIYRRLLHGRLQRG